MRVPGTTNDTGTEALFGSLSGIAIDSLGNLYVAQGEDQTTREMTPGGKVSALAGAAGLKGSQEGMGLSARFNGPTGLATDAKGNFYFTETNNHVVRKRNTSGEILTVAGTPGVPGNTDGTGTAGLFTGPQGLAVAADGSLFVADSGNHTIRRVTPDGQVTNVGAAF